MYRAALVGLADDARLLVPCSRIQAGRFVRQGQRLLFSISSTASRQRSTPKRWSSYNTFIIAMFSGTALGAFLKCAKFASFPWLALPEYEIVFSTTEVESIIFMFDEFSGIFRIIF